MDERHPRSQTSDPADPAASPWSVAFPPPAGSTLQPLPPDADRRRLPVPAQAPPATPPRGMAAAEICPPPPPAPALLGDHRRRMPEVREDFERPSSARVCDYLLGGAMHGAADRAHADNLLAADPGLPQVLHHQRAFTRRAVRFLLAAGIEQFIDLGSGVPTIGAVHEVIASEGSSARVASVDVDQVAVSHGRHLLAGHPGATMCSADVRDVDAVLDAPEVREVVDLSRPVGLLAFSVLQHVCDLDDPVRLLDDYLARLRPASALALSHYASMRETAAQAVVEDEIEFLSQHLARAAPRGRTRTAVATLLDGVDLVSPGVVRDCCWRPAPGRGVRAEQSRHWVGVGFRS